MVSRRDLDQLPVVVAMSRSSGLVGTSIGTILEINNFGEVRSKEDLGLECEDHQYQGVIRSASIFSSDLFVNVYMPDIDVGILNSRNVLCSIYRQDNNNIFASFQFTYMLPTLDPVITTTSSLSGTPSPGNNS